MAKNQHDNEQRKEELQTKEGLQTNEQMNEKQEKKRFFQKFKKKLADYVEDKYIIHYFENRGINHTPKESVSLLKKGKSGAWIFHMDSLYENFKNGVPIMELVLQMIFRTEVTNVTDVVPEGIINSFSDYESIKKHLTVQLLNMEKNEDFLKGKLFFPFVDLAVAICFVVENNASAVGMMHVPEWMADRWKVSKEQVLKDAITNTEKMFPAKIYTAKEYAESVSETLPKEKKDDFAKYMNPPENRPSGIFTASNEKDFWGTNVMLYPHFLSDFAKAHNAEKLLLLTASVHDLLIITNMSNLTPEACHEAMEEMEIFETVPEAYLSNTPYLYDANSDTISIWNGKEETEQSK